MRVQWNPEPPECLRARYPAAVTDLYDHDAIRAGRQQRPSNQARHVFDWFDGLRMIVSHDRVPDGRTGLFLSISVLPYTPLVKRLATSKGDPENAVRDLVCERWQALSGSDRTPELMGWSAGKGVPHFVVWDAEPPVPTDREAP